MDLNYVVVSRLRVLFCIIAFFLPVSSTYASLYVGGSVLNIVNHLFPTYLTLGSETLRYTTNGISLNAGYRLRMKNFVLASEFDVGSFFDADSNIIYKGRKHYVNATYYLAIKGKLGFYVKPKFMVYGLLGLSQNSIGDRIFESHDFNTKQISLLYGGGLEFYPLRDSRVAFFPEFFYFTPTSMTSYTGGAGPSSEYSTSLRGAILQLGTRYYFD